MARKNFDSLSCIPSPETIRKKLNETEQLASRLRVLLRVSEEIAQPQRPANQDQPLAEGARHAG
jgi:hypothetical protein